MDALEKVVPCGVAQEVWVEQGQELHGRLAWRPRDVVEVGDERVQPRAVDRDRRQLIREARPGRVAEAGPGSPPAREIVFGRRPVGAQVPPRGVDERDLGVDVVPRVQPVPRVDEGHALSAVRAEAQAAVARGGLEHPSPSRPEGFDDALRLAPSDDRDELFAAHRLAVEGFADVVHQLPELRLRHLDEFQPGVAQLDPAAAHRGGEERQIVGAREVQRAAHQPRLDQGALGPERLANVGDGAVDADGDLELGGGHELCLDATDLAHRPRQVLLGGATGQVVALQAERVDLGPGQLGGDGSIGFHSKRPTRRAPGLW